MSYSFDLSFQQPTSWRDLLAGLQGHLPSDLRVAVEKPRPGSGMGEVTVVFRERLSTRGVELSQSAGTLALRIPALSADEDQALAFRILERLGNQQGVTITRHGFEAIPATNLPGEALEQELAVARTAELSALRELVEQGQVVEFPGAVRPFFVGPRLWSSANSTGRMEDLRARLLAAFRTLQHAHLRGYTASPALGLRKEEKTVSAAAWVPGKAHLFPAVQLLLLKAEGKPVEFPLAGLEALAESRAVWADEKQVLVEAFTEQEWPALLARARALTGVKS